MAPWNATEPCTILDEPWPVQVLHEDWWMNDWLMAQRRTLTTGGEWSSTARASASATMPRDRRASSGAALFAPSLA